MCSLDCSLKYRAHLSEPAGHLRLLLSAGPYATHPRASLMPSVRFRRNSLENSGEPAISTTVSREALAGMVSKFGHLRTVLVQFPDAREAEEAHSKADGQ